MLLLFRQAAMVVGLFAGPRLLRRALHRHTTVKKRLIGLPGKSGSRPAILYSKEETRKRPVFIIIAGLSPFFQKRQHLHRLAKALAVVGYHVIIVHSEDTPPHLPDQIEPAEIDDIVAAVHKDGRFDSRRIVLGAFDFGSAYLFAAMNSSDTLRKVHSFLFLAPVTDVTTLINFALRSRVRIRRRWYLRTSSVKIRLLYLLYVLKRGLQADHFNQVSDIVNLLYMDRRSDAFRRVQSLDPALRHLLLSVFKGEMDDEAVRSLLEMYQQDLDVLFSEAVPTKDIGRPVFIMHSIHDTDIDNGQSQRLWEKLSSSAGVYLHTTDFIPADGYRRWIANPARWLRGAFLMTRALYRVLACLYSDKNLPYNPTQTAHRMRI